MEGVQWLTSFPSYGYLIAIKEANFTNAAELFEAEQITFADIGVIEEKRGIRLCSQGSKTGLDL
jgi:selenophosphate synthetase-related protein